MMKFLSSVLALTSLLAPASVQAQDVDIFTAANSTGEFTELLALIESTSLSAFLANVPGEFTVFAPTDEAFAAANLFPDGVVDETAAIAIVSYHVVAGPRLAAELETGTLTTITGGTIDVTVGADGSVTLNDGQATVTVPDIVGNNGVVHGISGILSPPETASPSVAPSTGGMMMDDGSAAPSASPVEADSDAPSGGSPEGDAASTTSWMAVAATMSAMGALLVW